MKEALHGQPMRLAACASSHVTQIVGNSHRLCVALVHACSSMLHPCHDCMFMQAQQGACACFARAASTLCSMPCHQALAGT